MSPTIDGPRLIRPDESEDAMRHTEQHFGFDPGELEARLPHCFDDSHPERHVIIKRDETVVSHVARIPVKLQAGAARVECHGIAGVATDPDYRENGDMTRLLEFWLDRPDESGAPLAELEGNRGAVRSVRVGERRS